MAKFYLIFDKKFQWKELIEKTSVSSASIAGDKLIINYLKDTLSQVEFPMIFKKISKELPYENIGTLSGFNGRFDSYNLFEFSNFTSNQRVYELDSRRSNILCMGNYYQKFKYK